MFFGRFFLNGGRIVNVFLKDILAALHFVLFMYGNIKRKVKKVVSLMNFKCSQLTLLESSETMSNKRIFFLLFLL